MRPIEGVLLLAFALGTIATFVVEIAIAPATARETALFGAVEFLLAVAIGWVVQRAAARGEFETSMKRLAVSAHRRVSDIGKSAERLRNEVLALRRAASGGRIAELDVLRVLAEEMMNTIRSATYDWAEIIGDELRKLDKVRGLEEELRKAETGTPEDSHLLARVDQLKREIGEIREDIPVLLREQKEDSLPREGRLSPVVAQQFLNDAEKERTLYFVVEGQEPLSENEAEVPEGPFFIGGEQNMFKMYLTVGSARGASSGLVVNPLGEEVYGNDYMETLLRVLGIDWNEVEGNLRGLRIDNSEYAGKTDVPGQFRVRVRLDEDGTERVKEVSRRAELRQTGYPLS